jgi:hypothetical protein
MFVWAARFIATEGDLVFGDQEEMGFGVRVATPLSEKNGGAITNSEGLTSAKQTWGQPARWCDYSGKINGVPAGIKVELGPSTVAPWWWHNRDYGLMVANGFGRKAMKQGEKQSLVVKKGSDLIIGAVVSLHSGDFVLPSARKGK